MSALLSAPRVVLLAVHLATKSDIQTLTALAAQHSHVLHKELLLRILLTVLPETLSPSHYVDLVERIQSGNWDRDDTVSHDIDTSSVADINDKEATSKVRKLRLLSLAWDGAPQDILDDPLSLFLLRRAHRVDQEAGLLTQLPDLIVPFLDHAPAIRTWMISSLLPLLRRNCQYYPETPLDISLAAVENLDHRIAVGLLLDQTGAREDSLPLVGRDLRGLIGPWLYNPVRWTTQQTAGQEGLEEGDCACPAWEEVLEWLTAKAVTSWRVVISAVDQWDGPADVDLGDHGSLWFGDTEQGYLERRYARAALACAYLVPEASVDALVGVNTVITKVMSLLDQDACPTLQVASSLLSPFTDVTSDPLLSPKNATYLRNDLLKDSNPLTTPSEQSTKLLHALTLSAYILTKSGAPCCIRRAGELAFLQDEREQKAEAMRMIRCIGSNGPKNDDKYWLRARDELLWLRDWGAEEDWGVAAPTEARGVLGQVKKEFLEVECLKAFLTNTRYALARSIYEEPSDEVLDSRVLRDTVISAAMTSYDNATNPHRGRGGLLKCHDIVHAFPKTVPQSSAEAKRIEALLRATHALGEYRLVLKQGEPFTPVVLRVHTDPISIVGKVLEQNPKSYTKIQDFLEIGVNMVNAGLTAKQHKTSPQQPKAAKAAPAEQLSQEQLEHQRLLVEQRITAMCVDAALTEDDFETAYSYVVNRLASSSNNYTGHKAAAAGTATPSESDDQYAWKAALQAGRYRRTAKTLRPTHIGTASGNLDIRHLEQRIECLSTALRIAPPSTLQEILNVFRKCEEELNAAVKADEASESAWDAQSAAVQNMTGSGEYQAMPGGFSNTVPAGVGRSGRPLRPEPAGSFASTSSNYSTTEEAPMSLFDLSRASIARAQKTLPALAKLQRIGSSASNNNSSSRYGGGGGGGGSGSDAGRSPTLGGGGYHDDSGGGGGGGGGGGYGSSGEAHGRAAGPRKRDQLREAAVGTLASGVGWLIGAQPVSAAASSSDRGQYGDHDDDDDDDDNDEERDEHGR